MKRILIVWIPIFALSCYFAGNTSLRMAFFSFFVLSIFPLSWLRKLDWLVVHTHEVGHGLAAEATDGKWDHYELKEDGGGVCYSMGGGRIAILLAGYLGTILLGVVLLGLAPWGVAANLGMMMFGLFNLTVGLYKANSHLTRLISSASGVVLVALAYSLKEWPWSSKLVCIFLACALISLGIRILIDLTVGIQQGQVPDDSDIHKLAGVLGLAPLKMSGLMTACGFLMLVGALYYLARVPGIVSA